MFESVLEWSLLLTVQFYAYTGLSQAMFYGADMKVGDHVYSQKVAADFFCPAWAVHEDPAPHIICRTDSCLYTRYSDAK